MSYHTPLDASLVTVKAQTRAERKRLEREQQKLDAKYTLTRRQIENMKLEMRKEIIQDEVKIIEKIMYAAFIIALHDKEGFGKVRIDRTLHHAMEQLECVKAGYLTKEELAALAEEIEGKAKKVVKE